ncbi:Probable galacturonosyltransferase 5 [Linum perenne]
MWFLSYPPGNATIHIQSVENFEGLSASYSSILKKQNSSDPRYTSELNHLRFYLPDLFPKLNKVVLFDHDVVVRRDVSGLWDLDLKGKVNGKFDERACTWAFGMNLFDLKQWRRQDLTSVYHNYLRLGSKRPLWKSGSLPLGWATFYNSTTAIDKRWHRLGLGYESGVEAHEIQEAAVLHYDGVMKPWLDIGISKYKGYWTAFLNYDNPHFQQCNIHQ